MVWNNFTRTICTAVFSTLLLTSHAAAFTGTGADWPDCDPDDIGGSFGDWNFQIEPIENAVLWTEVEGSFGIFVEFEGLDRLAEQERADPIAFNLMVTDPAWIPHFHNNPRLWLTLFAADTDYVGAKFENSPDALEIAESYLHYSDFVFDLPEDYQKYTDENMVLQGYAFDRGYKDEVPMKGFFQILSHSQNIILAAVLLPEIDGEEGSYPDYFNVSSNGLQQAIQKIDDNIGILCHK